MKNQYISWILFTIVVVTVYNLFYKPRTNDLWASLSSRSGGNREKTLVTAIDPVSWNACPLYGFECPSSSSPCDCKRLCIDGEQFVPFRVLENDEIYVLNQRLSPGTYCLPKGLEACDQRTSVILYSLTGWICPTRNESFYSDGKLLACKHPDAADNASNVLWDYSKNEKASWNIDSYEMHGKRLRYRCKCNSTDKNGRKLLNIIPFVCSVDYCIRDFKSPMPGMGWNGTKCLCGVYEHSDPLDDTSPCVAERTHLDGVKKLVGRVECTSESSWVKRPIFCPDGENFLTFTTPFVESEHTRDFLEKTLF